MPGRRNARDENLWQRRRLVAPAVSSEAREIVEPVVFQAIRVGLEIKTLSVSHDDLQSKKSFKAYLSFVVLFLLGWSRRREVEGL